MKNRHDILSDQDRSALVVAVLHYEGKKSQREIGLQLGMNPTQISRLLAHAERCGFVIPARINYPLDENLSLKINLIQSLPNVVDIIIAWTDPMMSEQSIINAVGATAAKFWEQFEQTFYSGSGNYKLAFSGGRGIAAVVDHVRLNEKTVHECFSIANIPTGDWQYSADTNLAVLKRRFPKNVNPNNESSKPTILIRPLGTLPFSPEMKEEAIVESRKKVLEQDRVVELMDDFKECKLVFTGIGSMADSNLKKMIKAIGLSPEAVPKTVTGDIGYNFVHHDRNVIHENDDLGKRLISVPMRDLQAIARGREKNRVVAVAWGAFKAAPLLDAYRGGLVNAMVIDTALGKEMLRLLKENKYLNV